MLGRLNDGLADGSTGGLAEVLIENRAIRASERLLVETCLQARYDGIFPCSSGPRPKNQNHQ